MSKFYNGSELLSRHYMINMVCGSRFGGKSTWAQRYALKRAIQSKGKSQFALVFRDVEQLGGDTAKTYFDNTLMMWYPDFEMEFKRGIYKLHNKNTDEKFEVGHAFAIKRATKMKSSSYPLVDTIILEEFINLEGKYIKSAQEPDLEVKMFISLIQTVFRGNGKQFKDTGKVFLISNAYGLGNPYMRYFRMIDTIVANPFKRFYEFKSRKDKDGNIEVPDILLERVDNDIKDGFGGDNAGSRWNDFRNELHLVKKPNIKNVNLQLTFDNRIFINVSRYNDSIIFTKTNKMNKDIFCYSCSDTKRFDIAHINVLKGTTEYDVIKSAFERNTAYYDCMDTYLEIYNIMSF